MHRLSALDAAFLYLETPDTPMHIGSLTVFRASENADGLFERFVAHTRARLSLLPSYTRRLKPTPLDLDHPVWTPAEPELDWHLRHCALPSPGTMEQLRAEVARQHAIPLERSRPLWQYCLIEGLQDGGFAVYAKVHHAAMDGVAGLGTLGVVYDFVPDAPPPRPRPKMDDEQEPDALELTSSALADFVRQIGRAISGTPSLVRTLAGLYPNLMRDARAVLSYARGAPQTRLNRPIRRERVFATSSLPLADVKALAKETGSTINDIVLALSAGALRRYLESHDDLPEKPLVAAVPASLREKDDWRLNNQVVFTLAHLPTDIDDPRERLAAAKLSMQESKEIFGEVRGLITTDFSAPGAPIVTEALAHLPGSRATQALPSWFNIVISNVPGPNRPMYFDRAAATHYFPVSIPYHNNALNITVQSYCDTLDFGLVACRRAVPDAQAIADAIVEEFESLARPARKNPPRRPRAAAPKKSAARAKKRPAKSA